MYQHKIQKPITKLWRFTRNLTKTERTTKKITSMNFGVFVLFALFLTLKQNYYWVQSLYITNKSNIHLDWIVDLASTTQMNKKSTLLLSNYVYLKHFIDISKWFLDAQYFSFVELYSQKNVHLQQFSMNQCVKIFFNSP